MKKHSPASTKFRMGTESHGVAPYNPASRGLKDLGQPRQQDSIINPNPAPLSCIPSLSEMNWCGPLHKGKEAQKKGSCLRVSIAVIKQHDHSNWGEKGYYLLTLPHHSPPLKERTAKNLSSQEQMQKSWRGATYCLLSDSPQDHQPRVARTTTVGWALLTEPLRLACSLILWALSQLPFPPLRCLQFVPGWLSQAAPSTTYHLCDYEQNNWPSHN